MDRAVLLSSSPDVLSPPQQPDGSPSADANRAQFELTLAGESPVLEWVFRDALGNDIPCEVRWVRLQSGEHRLIRGSITDITERKRTELLAAGERRVFERLAANVDLRITLEAITEVDRTRLARHRVRAATARRDGHAPESLRRPAPARRVRACLRSRSR